MIGRYPVSVAGAQPKGPYSPAIVAEGRFLFVAGQGPVDPISQQVVDGPFETHARRALDNLAAVVDAAGGSLRDAVKVQVFLADIASFRELNGIYEDYFVKPYPVRTTVATSLPLGYAIEVDAIVALPTGHGDATDRAPAHHS